MLPELTALLTRYVTLQNVVPVLRLLTWVLVLAFLYQYAFRGVLLYLKLRALAGRIRAVRVDSNAEVKRALNGLLNDSCVGFAWSEYEETLHEQFEVTGSERRVSDIRATLPASAFINVETVVEPRIGAEFYRHLPGILTGFGIIGTFSGLIAGLLRFNPSVKEPDALRESLLGLFQNVEAAFAFSAVAIALAISVTLVEKWLYSACSKWIGELVQALDVRFRAGIGEEYLSSLVQASQESATQVRQLKESMVEDLKVLLTNLTERQIAATHELGIEVGRQIQSGLQEPLERIAETVRIASGEQTQAASAILENLMTAFMAQMRETLGGQLSDLSGLMQQTASSMTQVELTLRSLVTDMRNASEESSTGIRAAMGELLQKLAEHQDSQSKAVQIAATSVFAEMQGALTRMADAQEAANARSQEAVQVVATTMADQVRQLSGANEATLGEARKVITQLGAVSTQSFDKLANGATAVSTAVENLRETLEKMTRVAAQLTVLEKQSAQAAQQVMQTTGNLATASQSLANGMGQMTNATTRLEAIARQVSTEQEQRSKLLREVDTLLQTTRATGSEFTRLAAEMKTILQTAFDEFGTGVSQNLSKHLADYQKQLGNAVSMLQSALEELAEHAERPGR